MGADWSVEALVVDSNACNDASFTVLDLSSFANLRVFEVGDYSFAFVNEVRLVGLSALERVVIGAYCFTKNRIWFGRECDHRFVLRNCERVRELVIGRWSFPGFGVCEIENVPSLEVVSIGDLIDESFCFLYASLELKSEGERRRMRIRPAEVEDTCVWQSGFPGSDARCL